MITDQDRRQGIAKEEGATEGKVGQKVLATDETRIEHGLGQEMGSWKRKKEKKILRRIRQEARK